MRYPVCAALIIGFLFTYDSLAIEESQYLDKLLEKAQSNKIAEHPTWLKLLHYKKSFLFNSTYVSEINSDRFFLSPTGKTDPKEELKASLTAFAQPQTDDPNLHPQCVFRARYLWLRTILSFGTNDYPQVICHRYNEWIHNGQITSISLVYASGYLENPASFYGHILIKFNSAEERWDFNLLDVSVNYGAIFPENENIFKYVFKGLFGGYSGGFSHIQYYFHNHNYGEIELRDLWEYELNLTETEISLITAHLWELLGLEYAYYFFKENCAHRVAEIIELLEDTEINPRNPLYAIPQSVIQNISLSKHKIHPLIGSIKYRPSRQSRFYQKYATMNPVQKRLFSTAAENIVSLESEQFTALDIPSKQLVLDTLIDYFQYIKNQGSSSSDSVNNEKYRKALVTRLSLPVSEPENHSVITINANSHSPDRGRSPSLLQISRMESSVSGIGESILIRPAYYDTLDTDLLHLKNSALKMFEARAIRFDDKFFLRSLNIFDIESVNPGVTGLPGDSGKSWKLQFGLEQQNLDCSDCLVSRFQGDIGYSKNLIDQLLIGGYLGAAIQTNKNDYGTFYPKATLFANIDLTDNLKFRLLFEHQHFLNNMVENRNFARFDSRYRLVQNWAVRLSYARENDKIHEAALSLDWYW